MKTPIEVYNSFIRIPRTVPTALVRELDQDTAYKVEGAEMSPAFRKRYWDGKEHLLKFSARDAVYKLPTGLLADLLASPLGAEFEIVDKRPPLGEARVFEWIGHDPREHQVNAIDAALKDRDITTGRGLLNLPIRSGKTLTAARIIQKLGLKTTFVVPSEMLLTQTVKAFQSFLSPAPVGAIGGGQWDPNFITVITNQSLATNPKALEAIRGTDLLFVDEAHHLEAPAWRRPLMELDARYKLGLSATIFANKAIPAEQNAIWLKATCGPILFRVSMRQLFDAGLLVPPTILIYPVAQKGEPYARWSFQTVYQKLIVENYQRNHGIADLAQQGVERGMKVLIDTGRTAQMKFLVEALKARDVRVREMHGKTPPEKRKTVLADFVEGRVDVLVGTILGEGVDIPVLDMVINAEGLKSKKAVLQRMRNLTPSEGKTSATFVDFADMVHPQLRSHSLERLQLYKSIRGFHIRAGLEKDGKFFLPEKL